MYVCEVLENLLNVVVLSGISTCKSEKNEFFVIFLMGIILKESHRDTVADLYKDLRRRCLVLRKFFLND